MEKFQQLNEEAIKNYRIADHILNKTYPLLKDTRMLVGVTENIFLALTNAVWTKTFQIFRPPIIVGLLGPGSGYHLKRMDGFVQPGLSIAVHIIFSPDYRIKIANFHWIRVRSIAVVIESDLNPKNKSIALIVQIIGDWTGDE